MPTIKIKGEDLKDVAVRTFPGADRDINRVFELLDQNPQLSAFDEFLEGEIEINLPDIEQIQQFSQPIFDEVGTALGGAKGAIAQIQGKIEGVQGQLPPQLRGYAQSALSLLGEVNGAAGKAELVLNKAQQGLAGAMRKYKDGSTNLIPWLLGEAKMLTRDKNKGS